MFETKISLACSRLKSCSTRLPLSISLSMNPQLADASDSNGNMDLDGDMRPLYTICWLSLVSMPSRMSSWFEHDSVAVPVGDKVGLRVEVGDAVGSGVGDAVLAA